MGSSKKHKRDKDKEPKKKKHRSRTRSRSPINGERERERRHHKKHKDRKRERSRSPDVEEVPVDSHIQNLPKPSNSRSGTRSSEQRSSEQRSSEQRSAEQRSAEQRSAEQRSAEQRSAEQRAITPPVDNEPIKASESLSIQATNRIRAKLGLKPLQVEDEKPAEDGKLKDDLGEFYHKPAANLSEKVKADKIRAKLAERKERRQLEQRLLQGSLADGSDDEDSSAWIQRNREVAKQKEDAAKRAAMLDEMDAVFGVEALVQQEVATERSAHYTARDLLGLRVAHDTDNLMEGRDVVLTLADKGVLDEDDGDTLVNVNMIDDEKYKKNIINRKKAKEGYQAYDDAEEIEAAAMGHSRPVLAKYDEDLDGEKPSFNAGFVIGDEDAEEAKNFRKMMIREKLSAKRMESLEMPELRLASDYYSEQELETKFKKPKKRGKMRKKPKFEPIDVEEHDPANMPLDTDDTEVKPDNDMKTESMVEEEERDTELEVALAKARRLRLKEKQLKIPKVEEILEQVKTESADEAAGGAIVLDSTAEFCRTLGDIPTYGQAGNRDNIDEQLMDFDVEEEDMSDKQAGAWSQVDVNAEAPPDITASSAVPILDVEPSLGSGVGGALRLALSKGYLERGPGGPAPAAARLAHLLEAQNYSIDDKAHNEDDKFSRRGADHHHRYAGPLQDFREKDNFRPEVKLEYVDDDGHVLAPKEAFRYLSHKFHGKGPGKNKQEKRIKKNIQDVLMQKMSSTDTPLGTLAMLQGKQKETHSPYVLLSGPKKAM